MKKSAGIGLFLVVVLSLSAVSGLAQVGDPQPPPPPTLPCTGCKMAGEAYPTPLVLEGTLILNTLGGPADRRLGLIREVARSLLQTDQLSMVYRTESGPPAIGKLFDGETALSEVHYHKLAFDAVEGRLFEQVKDFLVTDGKRYFRIVLDQTESKGLLDVTATTWP